MKLTTNQINLILYSLEQQQIEFNEEEIKDFQVIINELEKLKN